MAMTEWRDFPAGQPGLAKWLSELAVEGWDVGEPIATFDERGVAVMRYPVRRI